jgi:hypothetical protein
MHPYPEAPVGEHLPSQASPSTIILAEIIPPPANRPRADPHGPLMVAAILNASEL